LPLSVFSLSRFPLSALLTYLYHHGIVHLRTESFGEPMATFGETLRQARAHKNVTLREAEADTRINRHHLAALEDENFDALPPKIYSRGIVRKYADYLGLDAGKVLDMFREADGSAHDVSPVYHTPTEMPRMWTPNFAIVAFGVVLSAIVFAWGYSIWLSPPADVDNLPTATTTTLAATQSFDAPRPTAPAAPTAVVTAPPATEAPVVDAGGDNQTAAESQAPVESTVFRTGIGVTVTAETAVTVEVDGQVVFNGVLGAGTATEMFVGSDFVVTTGDATVTYLMNSCGETPQTPMTSNSLAFSASERSCPAPTGN
jgi:cytoskeletal protein RodZ